LTERPVFDEQKRSTTVAFGAKALEAECVIAVGPHDTAMSETRLALPAAFTQFPDFSRDVHRSTRHIGVSSSRHSR
jgi:hypothetical protein